MFNCVRHGEVEQTISGFCVDCCGEDHICETCGLRSGNPDGFTLVEWRGKMFSGDGQMLCDDCVECADCGGVVQDAEDRHWNYDEYLCDPCVQARDESEEKEEE